ncbi:zinc-binding alcohol dehydrogenase [Paractinoplanes deccanensis]|uniref:Zinc-binding alcohol dehydrogenase n=1 Tax=Paractinoplanes deccanensis TaxID=113561 RepID=A0ABQ3YLQ3_9ACTN|nr:zinc-binding dehydrogenase [Actinoplanes deccanensis]GID80860.1 zinc-binding alcohol dehydrogenase [Actinoplanes deccanensis]
MRALRIHAWGASPVIDDIPEPVRGDGEVLVQVDAAGMAHLDLTVASGEFGMRPALPYTGGVEGSGTVLEADDLAPGTQVMLRGGGLGVVRDGTWQERVSVPRKAVSLLDTPLPANLAATFLGPTTTAAVTLHDVAKLTAGEKVLVTGAAGAVGSLVCQLARQAGAEVTGLVGRPERLADLPGGVTGALLGEPPAGWAAERPFDLLVDTVGGDRLIERTRWVRAGGRAVVVGYTAGAEATVDLPNWLLADVALLPVNMMRHGRRGQELSPALSAQLAAGTLTLAIEQVPVEAAADALARLAKGQTRGRLVVTF